MNGMRFEAFTDPTDCDKRIEGDTGRSFLGHLIHCTSDVNVVPNQEGTVMSDGINKYFFIFFCVVPMA